MAKSIKPIVDRWTNMLNSIEKDAKLTEEDKVLTLQVIQGLVASKLEHWVKMKEKEERREMFAAAAGLEKNRFSVEFED